MPLNLNGVLQRPSYMGGTGDSKLKFVFPNLCGIDLLLDEFIFKSMSLVGVIYKFYKHCSSSSAVMKLMNVTSHIMSSLHTKTLKQISLYDWVISYWNRAMEFERRLLVHIRRTIAHRKEFRRKGGSLVRMLTASKSLCGLRERSVFLSSRLRN